jgi:membrane protease YdiL (CAAX protease family)
MSGASFWTRIFFGPQGLRAGWGLALFLIIQNGLLAAVAWAAQRFFAFPQQPEWRPELLLAVEGVMLVVALLSTAILARVEGRSFAIYGFPFRRILGARFAEGSLWGLLSISAVIGAMALAGAYSVSGLAVTGAKALGFAVLWALAALVASLYEELYFRGYPQFTLTRGIGFWPAAVLISFYFGASHYFEKPMETWMDFASTGLAALFFCFTLRRTGDLGFAIGWHFAYNFGSLFVFGGPNTGNQGKPVLGHLLDSSFHGPDWLTGGPMGPEASIFFLVMMAILFWAFHRRYPQVKYPAA